jgi:hypothetical protein
MFLNCGSGTSFWYVAIYQVAQKRTNVIFFMRSAAHFLAPSSIKKSIPARLPGRNRNNCRPDDAPRPGYGNIRVSLY